MESKVTEAALEVHPEAVQVFHEREGWVSGVRVPICWAAADAARRERLMREEVVNFMVETVCGGPVERL